MFFIPRVGVLARVLGGFFLVRGCGSLFGLASIAQFGFVLCQASADVALFLSFVQSPAVAIIWHKRSD
jgi:hypothetical protein